jgi:hypothetical protein
MYKYEVKEIEYKTGRSFMKVGASGQTMEDLNKLLKEMSDQGWEFIESKTTIVNAFTHSILLFFRKEV